MGTWFRRITYFERSKLSASKQRVVYHIAHNNRFQVAMRRTKSPTSVQEKLSNTGRSTLFQWFPQWWGWYSTGEDQNELKSDVYESTPVEETERDTQLESLEDEILDVIADTVENNTILRRDTVFGQFNFSLKEGNFRLCVGEADNEDKYVCMLA